MKVKKAEVCIHCGNVSDESYLCEQCYDRIKVDLEPGLYVAPFKEDHDAGVALCFLLIERDLVFVAGNAVAVNIDQFKDPTHWTGPFSLEEIRDLAVENRIQCQLIETQQKQHEVLMKSMETNLEFAIKLVKEAEGKVEKMLAKKDETPG